jgi:hypothetical protein
VSTGLLFRSVAPCMTLFHIWISAISATVTPEDGCLVCHTLSCVVVGTACYLDAVLPLRLMLSVIGLLNNLDMQHV